MKKVLRAFFTIAAVMTSTSSLASASTNSASLTKELLSVHDMSMGWGVGNDAGADGVGCLKNLLEPKSVRQTASAQVFYVYHGLVPAFDEKLATYTNTKKAYAAIIKTINGCHVISGYSPSGHHVTGTASSMSFKHVATTSAAYAIALTDVGVTLHYDYVIARKKNVVIAILEANSPSVSMSQFTGLVNRAIKKVH